MGSIGKSALVVISGVLLSAAPLAAQSEHTISARPGAVNYIEGSVSVNDKAIAAKELRAVFLNANDVLTTTSNGKAEVLLTPGVFLRVGDDSEVRMVNPSLTGTEVEIVRGEAMVEATGLVKDNNLRVMDHGTVTSILKNGLYRFTADNPPRVAVFDGKAQVILEGSTVDVKKGREVVLAAGAKTQKFDRKQTNGLYAWSNVRSEYQAAASYRVSNNASLGLLGSGYGYGPRGLGSGWYWDNGFNSWAWLPGPGAFYSPFGYGFYSPGYVGYAPIGPYYGRGGYWRGRGGWNGGGWNRGVVGQHPGPGALHSPHPGAPAMGARPGPGGFRGGGNIGAGAGPGPRFNGGARMGARPAGPRTN